MFRDCLACGSKDKWLQRKLVVEIDLTFQQAFTIVKATEAAGKVAKDLQQHSIMPVNSIHGERERHQNQPQLHPKLQVCQERHATDVEVSIKPQTVNFAKQNAMFVRKRACRNKRDF